MAEIEIDNIRKLVAARANGQVFGIEDFQVFDQGGPAAKENFVAEWKEGL